MPVTGLLNGVSKKFDIGFSATLWNRVDVDFSFFNISGSNLILNTPTSPSLGIPGNSITSNVGSMVNSGIELSVSANVWQSAS